MQVHQNDAAAANPPMPKEIVSVNSRGGSSGNLAGKVVFVVGVFAIVLVGALLGFNKWRAAKKADQAILEQTAKGENKPAAVGQRRTFNSDPPPLPGAQPKREPAASVLADAANRQNPICADGMPGTVMLLPDGKPMMAAGGAPMRVCKDGRVMVPALQAQGGAAPIAVSGNQQGTPPPSRYAGDVIVAAPPGSLSGNPQSGAMNPNDPMTSLAMAQGMPGLGQKAQASLANFSGAAGAPQGGSGTNPPGSLGSLLTPSQTPMVTASMLGDRNMILPKGRTIDCGLSMRLVNDVAGMASCVLPANVYSDNGRVVLLERGSEATGEYVAAMAQGQRRLFVLWTRIKTPGGVVINLNSPAADGLGTAGMDGYIDNHWWERIGAAFLLSLVQDAIEYEKAAKSAANGGQSVAVLQSSSQTGNRMAEKVLDSTINIKPTLYKNQGDRGAIYVARDLDFGGVYALRAR
jgi:type IV secretion system protein VirB10